MTAHVTSRAARLVSVAAALVGVIACGGSSNTHEAAADAAPAVPPTEVALTADQIASGGVKWAPATTATATEIVELPGELMVNEDQTARISAPERGRLLSIAANVGDRATAGQVLATLQSETATAARAERVKAIAERDSRQAALDFAKAARERAERLLALKAVSMQEVERARADEAAAASALAQARADIERAETALSVLGVDPATGHIRLTSTIAGVVLSRDAVAGAVVDAGATILVVTNPDTLWLKVAVPDSLIGSIRSGARLEFSVAAIPGMTFDAHAGNLAPSVDAASRSLPVRAVVVNRGGRLRPQMLATVRLERGQPRTGVAVPDGAIQLLNGKHVVFVVKPDGKGGATFVKKEIEIHAKAPDGVQIIQGIAKGDVIVIEGAFAVKAQFEKSKLQGGEG